MRFLVYCLVITLSVKLSISYSRKFAAYKKTFRSKKFNNDELTSLANTNDWDHFHDTLDEILIPRVVGTPNHERVHQFIIKELKKYDFEVTLDRSNQGTPIGRLQFRNIIGTLNPDAEAYLVLACHYDSKMFNNIHFVGAIDSAVPCAMMLNLIKVLHDELQRDKLKPFSLKLVFFDGEEAFERWGPNDSIYGARSLADTWMSNVGTSKTLEGESISDMDKVHHMVLLDLIGGARPKFYNYFDDTKKWYLKLSDIEKSLRGLRLLDVPNHVYFERQTKYAGIEDDHIPFIERGVKVVHLIPSRFPPVWHTARDDYNHLDMESIYDLSIILRIYVSQFLNGDTESDSEPAKIKDEM